MSASARRWTLTKNNLRNLWEEWQERIELRLLLAILFVGLGAWLFIELADEVIEGDTMTVDETILLALRNPADLTDPLGPPWVEEMGRDFTALGGSSIVMLFTGIVCFYLALARRWSLVILILAVVAGSTIFNQLLKAGFNRPRPDLVPHGMFVYHASFPSGHAMLAASTYLTLGVLLARLQQKRFQAIMIMGTAILITLLVGISRVYLAVHWPSDVLAGWTAGSIWATICWLAARQLRRMRHWRHEVVESEHPNSADASAQKKVP